MEPNQIAFDAIGTRWVIDVEKNISNQKLRSIENSVKEYIASFDAVYSRFRKDSLVSILAQKSGTHTLTDDGVNLIQLYKKLYSITGGAFTPLIGSVLEDAGYDATYSFKERSLIKPPSWEETLEFEKGTLTVNKPVVLDFGGLGKGYLIDKVGTLLQDADVSQFCIDAGGDILYRDRENRQIDVGLEHPENVNQVIGVAKIVNQSICASAGNRRKWGKYHHIINPHTLMSPNNILATWVVAETALIADALATCLFLVEPKVLLPYFTFEYCIVASDKSVACSRNFPVKFY